MGPGFSLTGGAGSVGQIGAIFPIFLNGQSLIKLPLVHRLSIVRLSFDSHACSVQAYGRNCILTEEEKVGMIGLSAEH